MELRVCREGPGRSGTLPPAGQAVSADKALPRNIPAASTCRHCVRILMAFEYCRICAIFWNQQQPQSFQSCSYIGCARQPATVHS